MNNKVMVILSAAAFVSCLPACKALAKFLEDREKDKEGTVSDEDAAEGGSDDEARTPSWTASDALRPPDKPLGAKAEVLSCLGFKRVADIEPYALEAVILSPGWGAASMKSEASRDGDLLTAWTCKPSAGGKPCVMSLVFPEDSKVHLLRIFAASGVSRKSFLDHGRAKLLRIYTDGGWVETKLKDTWDYQYVMLKGGVSTRNLTVEIRQVFSGKADGDILIAELEAFGTVGKKRPPLDIDVRKAVTRVDLAQWVSTGGSKTGGGKKGGGKKGGSKTGEVVDIRATPSWIEIVDGKGGARRLLRGTGIVGKKGDRYLLVERVTGASCPGAYLGYRGYFTIVDTETRLFQDVGGLGGVGSMVYRHPKGEGFAAASMNAEGVVGIGAVIIENGRLGLKKDSRPSLPEAEEVLRGWGFESAGRLCCDAGDMEELERACSPVDVKSAIKTIGFLPVQEWREIVQLDKQSPQGSWKKCSAGEGLRVIMSTIQECEEVPNVVVVVDKSGKVRGSVFGGTMGFAMLPGGELLIEVEKRGGSATAIYTVGSDGELRMTYPNAAFSIGLPPACRCSA